MSWFNLFTFSFLTFGSTTEIVYWGRSAYSPPKRFDRLVHSSRVSSTTACGAIRARFLLSSSMYCCVKISRFSPTLPSMMRLSTLRSTKAWKHLSLRLTKLSLYEVVCINSNLSWSIWLSLVLYRVTSSSIYYWRLEDELRMTRFKKSTSRDSVALVSSWSSISSWV